MRRMLGNALVWIAKYTAAAGTRCNKQFVVIATGPMPAGIASQVEGRTEEYMRDMETLQAKAHQLRGSPAHWL